MAPVSQRAGTYDLGIWQSVVDQNEYHLPDRFDAEDVVIDVGAHIGAFSYAALTRGARRVYAYECDPGNFHAAAANLAEFGERVVLEHAAVWETTGTVQFTGAGDVNTGGGSAGFGQMQVRSVAVDEVFRRAFADGAKEVRFLKMDCEGSEWVILPACSFLGKVRELRGEYHEHVVPAEARRGGLQLTKDWLVELLRARGFEAEAKVYKAGSTMGVFSAVRPPGILVRPWENW